MEQFGTKDTFETITLSLNHIMNFHQQVENIISSPANAPSTSGVDESSPQTAKALFVDHQLNHSELKMRFQLIVQNLLEQQCKD